VSRNIVRLSLLSGALILCGVALVGEHVILSHQREAVERQLRDTVIESVRFDETPVSEALDEIAFKFASLNPKSTVRIKLHSEVAQNIPITMSLQNVTTYDALLYTASLAQCALVHDNRAAIVGPFHTPLGHRRSLFEKLSSKISQIREKLFRGFNRNSDVPDPFADYGSAGPNKPAMDKPDLAAS
jgi:hypothetical protein